MAGGASNGAENSRGLPPKNPRPRARTLRSIRAFVIPGFNCQSFDIVQYYSGAKKGHDLPHSGPSMQASRSPTRNQS